jgi:hypothetical protein
VNLRSFGQLIPFSLATEGAEPIDLFLKHPSPIFFWLDPGRTLIFQLRWKAPFKAPMPVPQPSPRPWLEPSIDILPLQT